MKLHHLAVAGGVAWLATHWLHGGFAAAQDSPAQKHPGSDSASDDAGPKSTDDISHDNLSSSPLETARTLDVLQEQERPELGFPSASPKQGDDVKPGLSDFARGA